jgi:hypothetical protein
MTYTMRKGWNIYDLLTMLAIGNGSIRRMEWPKSKRLDVVDNVLVATEPLTADDIRADDWVEDGTIF